MTVAEAQEAVVAELREEGALRSEEPYAHSVPFSHRSGERIEPLISMQWFCRMDELAQPAIEVGRAHEVRFTPGAVEARLPGLDGEIRAWCISRQLWWGHRIPVWYCDDCEEVHVAEEEPALRRLRRRAGRRTQTCSTPGSPRRCGPSRPWAGPRRRRSCAPSTRPAVLDHGTGHPHLGRPHDHQRARVHGRRPVPRRLVHAAIQARDGRRMSKSRGTGTDPLEEIDIHGADACASAGSHPPPGHALLHDKSSGPRPRQQAVERRRLILLNPARSSAEAAAGQRRGPLDPSRSSDDRGVTGPSRPDFAPAAQAVCGFIWTELCDWYLEIAKPRPLRERGGAPRRRCSSSWTGRSRPLHPMMPFVTEESGPITLSARDTSPFTRSRRPTSRCSTPRPRPRSRAAIELTRRLRAWRDLAEVAGRQRSLPARVDGRSAAGVRRPPRPLRVRRADGGDPVASVGPVRGARHRRRSTPRRLRARLEERREELRAEVERAEGKLANEGFVANEDAFIAIIDIRRPRSPTCTEAGGTVSDYFHHKFGAAQSICRRQGAGPEKQLVVLVISGGNRHATSNENVMTGSAKVWVGTTTNRALFIALASL